MLTDFKDEDFDSKIKNEDVSVIQFSAAWCGPCKALKPIMDKLADEYKETRQENANLWKTVFEEDIFVVEGMQKGRYAKGFDGGRFSPVMDEPTHVFHDWYARKILNSF